VHHLSPDTGPVFGPEDLFAYVEEGRYEVQRRVGKMAARR
jgi:hypothetical protein